MAKVSVYLNFPGNTEEAFEFYRSVFGGEMSPVQRVGDLPAGEGPQPAAQDRDKVMHVELTILGGMVIMGTDLLGSLGQQVRIGNNTTISLEPDTLAETQRLYDELSVGATEAAPVDKHFWGYWGTCLDRYGVRWMFNFPADPAP